MTGSSSTVAISIGDRDNGDGVTAVANDARATQKKPIRPPIPKG
jgi:hypothetical protein